MNIKLQQSVFYKFKIFTLFNGMFAFILLSSIGLTTYSGALFAVSEDSSLESVEGTIFDSFKLADDVTFPASRKVYIEAVEAKFSREWMSKFRSETSRHYRKETLQKYAETFRSRISEELTNSGWIVLSTPEEGAMTVTAKLFNMYISGPDKVNITNALVLYIGRSGFELTIQDADNRLVLYINDNGVAGSPSESYFETNNSMNLARFSKLFYGWANNFTVYLNMIAGPSSTS